MLDSRVAGIGSLVMVVLLAGCSLVNPHVSWPRPAVERDAQGVAKSPTLDQGIAYANAAKDRYKSAVGDQATMTNALAIGLIPLGAAALGLGITQGSSVAITALGLTGGSAFGVGAWLNSRPRQLVYVAGIKAMNCAVTAMLPLGFSEAQADRLNRETDALAKSVASTSDQVDTVARLLDRVREEDPGHGIIADATRDLATAQAAVEAARTTHAGGMALAFERDRAGQTLIAAVDNIGAEVDRAIVSTLPDLQALPGIIGNLAQTSAQFARIPAPRASGERLTGEKAATELGVQGEPRVVTKELNAALGVLRTRVIRMQAHAVYVAAVVNSVGGGRSEATLKQCGVETVPTGITLDPPDPIEFEAGKARTKRLLVGGGKPPYIAELEEAPVEGLTVTAAWPWIVVQATDKVAAGTYTVRVTDSAGNSRSVVMTIRPATPPRAVAATATPAAEPTTDEKKRIARVLCVPDAEWGSERLQTAIRYFQAELTFKETGSLTDEQVKAVLDAKNGECRQGRRNFHENSLTEVRIKEVQKRLAAQLGVAVPESGALDEATRKAVQQFAADRKLAPADGTLTPAITKALGL